MIDKTTQLIIRFDLYGGALFVAVICVSLVELAVLYFNLSVGRYLIPAGWAVVVLAVMRAMWIAKTSHDLTAELQFYKIPGLLLIAAWCCWFLTDFVRLYDRLYDVTGLIKIIFVVNAISGLGACTIGVLVFWALQKVRAV